MIESVTHTNGKADEAMAALGRAAGRKLDDARVGTADRLASSAAAVRGASDAIDGIAESAAARLDSSASYLRSRDSGDLFVGLRNVVRRYPAGIIAGAVALGVMVGMKLGSKR